MRIENTQNTSSPYYVGKCKNNIFPKHVTNGVKKVVKLGKNRVTLWDSPKTDYVYIQNGDQMLWVKDKSILNEPALATTKIARTKKVEVVPES